VGVERSVSFNFEEDTVIVGKLSLEGEWEHVERPPMQNMHPPAFLRAPVPRATVEEIPDVERTTSHKTRFKSSHRTIFLEKTSRMQSQKNQKVDPNASEQNLHT
jgi:hypothetical protein